MVENSVALAMAQLDRLERDRAKFAAAKRAVAEQLEQQGLEVCALRGRLLAERPRAWARREREHVRRRERLELERARHAARADAEHRERLAVYAAELEAKRLQLAALDSAPIPEQPGRRAMRRAMEWAVPVAATVLVGFFAMLAIGEDAAVAHASASAEVHRAPVVEPELEPAVDVEAEPDVEASPEGIAVAPEPELHTPVVSKPVKPVVPKPAKPPKTPKNPNPLTLVDPNGDPLG